MEDLCDNLKDEDVDMERLQSAVKESKKQTLWNLESVECSDT